MNGLVVSNRRRIHKFAESTNCPQTLQQVVDLLVELESKERGLGSLPLDLLCRVTSYLDTVEKLTCFALVDRISNRIVRESASWSHAVLTSSLCARLGDVDLVLLSSFWGQLRVLSLCASNASQRALHLVLSRCLSLHELELSFCPFVSDHTLSNLARCVGLKHLHLRQCETLTDQTLMHIGKCTRLEQLSIAKVDITDLGLKFISTLPLVCLSIRSSEITDKGLLLLKNLGKLRSLFLSECEAGDIGVRAILLQCTLQICELNLSKTLVTDSICTTIASCINLTQLCLDGCKLTEVGLTLIARKCINLKQLSLGWIKDLTNESIHQLGDLNLVHLNLQHCAKLTDNSLNSLSVAAAAHTLKTLLLDGCHLITDMGITSLKQMDGLTFLSVTGCHRLSRVFARHLPQSVVVRA